MYFYQRSKINVPEHAIPSEALVGQQFQLSSGEVRPLTLCNLLRYIFTSRMYLLQLCPLSCSITTQFNRLPFLIFDLEDVCLTWRECHHRHLLWDSLSDRVGAMGLPRWGADNAMETSIWDPEASSVHQVQISWHSRWKMQNSQRWGLWGPSRTSTDGTAKG